MSLRRLVVAALGAAALFASLGLIGCHSAAQQERIYRMGEVATAGPLRYTIFDTEWKGSIGEGTDAHQPKNRYLIIHLSVTNSGGSLVEVPTMSLEKADGTSEAEVSEPLGVAEWLGMIRQLKPADTLQGKVVFDVPMSAYRLRVGGSADVTDEKTTQIEIPIQYAPAADPNASQPLGTSGR
jgi:hypothetical protein